MNIEGYNEFKIHSREWLLSIVEDTRDRSNPERASVADELFAEILSNIIDECVRKTTGKSWLNAIEGAKAWDDRRVARIIEKNKKREEEWRANHPNEHPSIAPENKDQVLKVYQELRS